SLQCWHEALFDIGVQHFSARWSVDRHWCHHLLMTKRRYEVIVFQVPCDASSITLTAWSAAIEPHHVGTDGRLGDKDQMGGVTQALRRIKRLSQHDRQRRQREVQQARRMALGGVPSLLPFPLRAFGEL